MKTIKLIALLALLISGFAYCTKNNDDYNSPGSSQTTTGVITQGSWRISGFSDGGIDKTAMFSGYAFSFDSSGTVTATSGSEVTNGTWASVSTVNENTFMINFGTTEAPLSALKDQWTVIERLATSLKMKKESSLAGHFDYLVIDKN